MATEQEPTVSQLRSTAVKSIPAPQGEEEPWAVSCLPSRTWQEAKPGAHEGTLDSTIPTLALAWLLLGLCIVLANDCLTLPTHTHTQAQ